MECSDDRILTTHVGSLPRSPELLALLVERNRNGARGSSEAFRTSVAAATDEIIARQRAAGVDIGGDGELPRIGFNIYVKDRIHGFGGTTVRKPFSDFVKYPGYRDLRTGAHSSDVVQEALAARSTAPAAVGEMVYDETLENAQEELSLFEEALERAGRPFTETFVTAASPGNVMTAMSLDPENPVYENDDAYVMGVAAALKHEYEEVVRRGHVLQIDAPDLAMERQIKWQDDSLDVFLEHIRVHVDAINLAIADLPADRVRLHVCWGNWDGPHVDDVPIEEVLPIIYGANVGAFSLPCGNPRHQHDHKRFKELPLPEGKLLVAGVIDVTTNYVEHPEVVADRLCQFAEHIDPHRLIASTDCGFSTFAGYTMVAPDVVWEKLRTLADGARIATERLL